MDHIKEEFYNTAKTNTMNLFPDGYTPPSRTMTSPLEARPSWQFLPPKPGYVPVYIRTGDTPLEEINPELAEAFHALPAGRSAGKLLDASPEAPEAPELPEFEQADQPQAQTQPEVAPEPYVTQKKSDVVVQDNPVERR